VSAVLVIIGLLTLGTAAAAMAGRNLLHSVLLLAGTWAGVAAFFLWAGAEFAAFAQILVYIGAISMVVLFAVLLTRRSREEPVPATASRTRKPYALLVGTAVGAVLLAALAGQPATPVRSPAPVANVREIGGDLMGPHAAALLAIGVLLTVALIGSVVLAAGERQEKPGRTP
jgi:NADH:ubiquinone oxidoreductase subunit 6 (subunit J)